MGKKGGVLIALVLLVTGGLRLMAPGGTPPPGSPQGDSKSESTKKEKPAPDHSRPSPHPSLGPESVDLSDTIEAFFGVNRDTPITSDQPASPESTATQRELIAHWNVPPRQRAAVKFLIALAPDPVHTELSLFFDRGIETIQQAAQEEGYDFDRATMPWDSSTHAESNDFQKRADEDATGAARESLPGLMIFRPALERLAPQTDDPADAPQKKTDDSADAPLFVFVVGETPTAGIHKNQFANALQIMCEIRGDCPAKKSAAP